MIQLPDFFIPFFTCAIDNDTIEKNRVVPRPIEIFRVIALVVFPAWSGAFEPACFSGKSGRNNPQYQAGFTTSRGVRHTFLRAAQILIFLILTLCIVKSCDEFFKFRFRFFVLNLVQSY